MVPFSSTLELEIPVVPMRITVAHGRGGRLIQKLIDFFADAALPRGPVSRGNAKNSNSDLSSNYPGSPLSLSPTPKYPGTQSGADVTRYFNDEVDLTKTRWVLIRVVVYDIAK